jgi:hypothetical protein
MPETTQGGVLIKGENGHITRGGEFEKRAAFIPIYELPAGTVGLATTRTSLLVFGHGADPGTPAGVDFQQLTHGGEQLVAVPSYDLFAGLPYVVGEFADGTLNHYYDGTLIEDWFDGRARATFQVVGGDGSSELTELTVNGISVINSTPVAWTTNNSATAAAIAAAIVADTSTPEYTATSFGDTVTVIADDPGTGPNGFAVVTTAGSGFVVSPSSGLVLAGGADSSVTYQPGPFVRTINRKIYAPSGPNLHFSGLSEPTQFTTDVTGAGFIDMSANASGAEEVEAVATYQGYIAVFSEGVTQIWYVDPDPTLNRIIQVLNNTGTGSPRSVTQFGDNDIFYLDESGLRSLRARDSSNAAATTDIGVPVDSLIVEKLQSLSAEEREKVFGLINPIDGRFWLCMIDMVFVFSFYANAKVSAWTTYVPSYVEDDETIGFEIEEAVVFNRRVYLRSGNQIFVYGGLDAAPTYDATVATAWLPYFDADRPTQQKEWSGIDAALEGTWEVRAAMQPTSLDTSDLVATLAATTYNAQRVPGVGSSTHLSPRFESSNDGEARLSAVVLHYSGGGDEG